MLHSNSHHIYCDAPMPHCYPSAAAFQWQKPESVQWWITETLTACPIATTGNLKRTYFFLQYVLGCSFYIVISILETIIKTITIKGKNIEIYSSTELLRVQRFVDLDKVRIMHNRLFSDPEWANFQFFFGIRATLNPTHCRKLSPRTMTVEGKVTMKVTLSVSQTSG